MSRQPILRGERLRPGTHVDLVGAFRADMREADDTCCAAPASLDSRETTLDHIGELKIPLAQGVIHPRQRAWRSLRPRRADAAAPMRLHFARMAAARILT